MTSELNCALHTQTNPLVLTADEASKLLRIGKNHIYELTRCGRLRSIRVGRKILIPHSAIREFLESAVG